MELVVRKNELLRELQLFQGIVERKNTIPILANVLIEAKGDEVRMLATDLEVALRSRCNAAVAKGGSLTLPDASGKARAVLPRSAVKEMVAKTQYAITGEDTRFFLNGAKLVLQPQSLTLVATDGHRLALVQVQHDTGVTQEVGVILPKKTLLELGKLLAEGEGDVQFESGENHLFFEVGERVLISRMIDGQFPTYERVIPKGNDKLIEFDRERLTSAVKRVALLSNERSRAVKFEIDTGKVEVTSSSSEFGEAHEQIQVEYPGPALTISFNAQYVLDFLNVVETDVVSLSLKDEVSQAVMKPVAAEGYDYTYVIMPMRI